MKTKALFPRAAFLAFLLSTLNPQLSTFAQGDLTPSGAPAPTMKSLQEIWDKIGVLEAQNKQLQTHLTLLSGLTVNFAWNLSTTDGVGRNRNYTSLAFGPDGQPTIAYRDITNFDLKFARFNGSTWALSTVDSAGDVGTYASLKYGPDGQPEISYFDNTYYHLKFARKGIFAPVP